MNITQKNLIKKYLLEANYFFPAFYPKKRKLLSELKVALHNFGTEHPEFTAEELYDLFGTPREYASLIIDNTDSDELRRNIKMKKRATIITISFCCFIVIVIFVCAAILSEFTSHLAYSHYDVIIEIEHHTIPDETSSDYNTSTDN